MNSKSKLFRSNIIRNSAVQMHDEGNCLSIMQPYIFPYIGYFQLIEASSEIVFYDDVNFIKQGWINRNRILMNRKEFLFTIPLEKASQNKNINQIQAKLDPTSKRKLLMQMKSAYSKAPLYKDVMNLIEKVFERGEYENIGDMGIQSIMSVYEYLGKSVKCSKSSISSYSSKGMEKADRLIAITKQFKYDKYVNTIGGQGIYQKEYFKNQGIELQFLKSGNVEYNQEGIDFVPNLSIIDVLMYNDKPTVLQFLKNYKLI